MSFIMKVLSGDAGLKPHHRNVFTVNLVWDLTQWELYA